MTADRRTEDAEWGVFADLKRDMDSRADSLPRLVPHAALDRAEFGPDCLVCGSDTCSDPGHYDLDMAKRQAARTAALPSSWAPVDLGPILAGEEGAEDRPTLLELGDGQCLLYTAAINAVSGVPEAGKSWLALAACRQVLAAGQVVVYIDHEDAPRPMVGRLRALGIGDDSIRQRFLYIRPAEPIRPADLDLIAAAVPTLVVVDGVNEGMRLEGLDLERNRDASEYLARVARPIMASTGAAVLLLDHVTKAADSRGRYAIGAQSKLAGVTGAAYALAIAAPFGRGRAGSSRVLLTKDRRGWVKTQGSNRLAAMLNLTSDETGERVSLRLDPPSEGGGGGGTFRPTRLMERVSRALEGSAGMSGYQVRQHVEGKAQAKLVALDVLAAEGYVETADGPRGSTVYTSAKPYREEFDLFPGREAEPDA